MEPELVIRESSTHYHIRLPVEGHELVVMVDKTDFTITIPSFEYMNVKSIVKVIVQLYKTNSKNPVVNNFLKFLRQSVNREEFENFIRVFRSSLD